MRSDDLVAFTYRADIYCPACTVKAVRRDYPEAGPLDSMNASEWLTETGKALGIAVQREETFDSDAFPKVVFRDSTTDDDYCGDCSDTLRGGAAADEVIV